MPPKKQLTQAEAAAAQRRADVERSLRKAEALGRSHAKRNVVPDSAQHAVRAGASQAENLARRVAYNQGYVQARQQEEARRAAMDKQKRR